MREKIVSIINQINPDLNVEEGTNFIKDGYLDSMEIMEIVVEIEDAFEVEIAPENIVPEYFESVDTLLKLVEETLQNKR